ncbi:hypothetical protein FXN61_24930 [Lentzea sp. PSKA42]|uniref:Alkylmercury lyase n=1 Tax=Lentzea indica TaxID=2604800 RepID=A0ABX1FLL0_9PSEU|nr:hypothetical protein [Lentzea indica]NKE59873.1 hypothetical protein [Lentzea indica]
MISEKANFRMRAALHAIRPGEPALPPELAAIVQDGPDRDLRGDDLAELLGVSMVYARACLMAAARPATALFSISEPHDDVIPVTTNVTFVASTPVGFEDHEQPLMVLSTEPAEFLYPCDDDQLRIMADTADALRELGLSREEAIAKVNAFWAVPAKRYPLLYGGWIGQQDGAGWARAMLDRAEVIIDG